MQEYARKTGQKRPGFSLVIFARASLRNALI
jgi:hypothetical protein